MTTGDIDDMARRVFAVLPQRWFPALEEAPILNAVLCGIGAAWSFCFRLISYVEGQARIATATGSFLDMIAVDFFGSALRRRTQERDQSFRQRISGSLFAEKATRLGVLSAVSGLTAASVEIFEPGRPMDTGGYAAIGSGGLGGGFGYGVAGLAYGSLNLPFQFLLRVQRPTVTSDVQQITGYGNLRSGYILRASGGYNFGALEYVGSSFLGDAVTDDDIRTIIIDTIPVNAVAWLCLI